MSLTQSPPCPSASVDADAVLRFAASFLWADFEIVDAERRFLLDLAYDLDVRDPHTTVTRLLKSPPLPEDVDPSTVSVATADAIRRAALDAIACDGRVDAFEMSMFELLDDLLPRTDLPHSCS